MIKFRSGDRPLLTKRGFSAESAHQYCLITDDGNDVVLAYERGADSGKSGRQIENPCTAETAEAKEQGYQDGEKIVATSKFSPSVVMPSNFADGKIYLWI